MDNPGGGGGIGRAAGELLEEMQKAQENLQKMDKLGGADGQSGAQFSNVMQAQQTQKVEASKEATQVNKAANVLQAAKTNLGVPRTAVGNAAKVEASKMGKMLANLINGQDKMTKIMNMALSGRQFSPPELISMQAGVYRFSQELELTSKVVEKATSGIKQTMNTQV